MYFQKPLCRKVFHRPLCQMLLLGVCLWSKAAPIQTVHVFGRRKIQWKLSVGLRIILSNWYVISVSVEVLKSWLFCQTHKKMKCHIPLLCFSDDRSLTGEYLTFKVLLRGLKNGEMGNMLLCDLHKHWQNKGTLYSYAWPITDKQLLRSVDLFISCYSIFSWLKGFRFFKPVCKNACW